MKVRGWEKFQHYKDRNPPWIKLHKTLLDDYEFQRLPLASKALAPMLWLLASEQIDGTIDGYPEKLAFRLRWNEKDIVEGILPLIDKGFIVIASESLAQYYQLAMPETEGEAEKRKRKSQRHTPSKKSSNEYSDEFLLFWKEYPKKEAKGDAWKAWKSKTPELFKILEALKWQTKTEQWLKDKGQFIPLPATYLRANRWEDEKQNNNSGVAVQKCEHPGCTKNANLRTSKGHRCTEHM